MPYATYRFNKIIAADTIRFIVTVAIVVYKGLIPVVGRILTKEIADLCLIKKNLTTHVARHHLLSYSLKISSLYEYLYKIGNDLETSKVL